MRRRNNGWVGMGLAGLGGLAVLVLTAGCPSGLPHPLCVEAGFMCFTDLPCCGSSTCDPTTNMCTVPGGTGGSGGSSSSASSSSSSSTASSTAASSSGGCGCACCPVISGVVQCSDDVENYACGPSCANCGTCCDANNGNPFMRPCEAGSNGIFGCGACGTGFHPCP